MCTKPMLANLRFRWWPDSEAHRPTRPRLLPPRTPDDGPLELSLSRSGPRNPEHRSSSRVRHRWVSIGGSALRTAAIMELVLCLVTFARVVSGGGVPRPGTQQPGSTTISRGSSNRETKGLQGAIGVRGGQRDAQPADPTEHPPCRMGPKAT